MTIKRLTKDELVARIYRHYPRGIAQNNPRYSASDESWRLACVHEAAAIACGKRFISVPDDHRVAIDPDIRAVIDRLESWRLFGRRCVAAFPDREVFDGSGPFFAPGYQYGVSQAGYTAPPISDDEYEHDDDVNDDDRERCDDAVTPHDRMDAVYCAVSCLAPVYQLVAWEDSSERLLDPIVYYSEFPPRYRDRVDSLAAIAEDTFGFTRLHDDILRTIVPDAQTPEGTTLMGTATIADFLFHPR